MERLGRRRNRDNRASQKYTRMTAAFAPRRRANIGVNWTDDASLFCGRHLRRRFSSRSEGAHPRSDHAAPPTQWGERRAIERDPLPGVNPRAFWRDAPLGPGHVGTVRLAKKLSVWLKIGRNNNLAWWSCGESNPGPLQCDCSALPSELQPRPDAVTTRRTPLPFKINLLSAFAYVASFILPTSKSVINHRIRSVTVTPV